MALAMPFVSLFPLVNASVVESVYVPDDGEIKTVTVSLQANQKLKGTFNVTGILPHIIDFWVRDPAGAVILDSGTVVDGANFTFTAKDKGEYMLNFQNNDNRGKNINLEYSIESGFMPSLPNEENTLLWIIIIALVICLILMGLVIAFLLRRRK